MEHLPPRGGVGTADRDANQSGFDPRELLRVLSAHRLTIVIGTAVVVAATALYAFTATPYYRAKLRILIERDSDRVVSFQEIYNLGTGTDDYYVTQFRILESRAVAEAALQLLPAAERAWFEQQSRDPAGTLMQLRTVQPVAKSRLVDIEAEHPDPNVACRIAQAVVDAYVQNVELRRRAASSDAVDKLRIEASELQGKLRTAQERTQEFKRRNKIVSMNDRQSLVAARLETLTRELSEVERERREVESMLVLADQVQIEEASFRTDLPEVLESPVIAEHKRALSIARQERSSLSQKYKEKHPRMIESDRRILAIETQLQTEMRSIQSGITRRHERLVRHEADVRSGLQQQTEALLELESKNIEFRILESEAENVRRLHEAIIGRLKEVEVVQDYQNTNVHPIGTAEVGAKPVRPRTLLSLAIALLGGLFMSCGIAFATDALDRSIKTPGDAVRLLGAPILGLVPRLPGKRERRGKVDPETYDTRSSLSEAFRTIRTNFAFTQAGRDVKSIVITSATAEEGKSTVSINFSVSLARSGKRVLLVDADMRRPRLHRAFDLHADEGLSSVLIGARELRDVVLPTPEPNLSILPCGLIPPNPIELLESPGGEAFQDLVLREFDIVVIDSPPVGIVSDACVLASRSDRVVFVVRSFSTDRAMSRRALQRLTDVGANLAGVILNHCDTRADRYGRYEYEYSYLSNYEYAEAADDDEATESQWTADVSEDQSVEVRT